MATLNPISALFNLKKPAEPIQSTPVITNPDGKFANETYVYYGKRICGVVTANLPALAPFLHKIYNSEKQRQINDQALQEQRKNELANELCQTDGKISKERNHLDAIKSKISSCQDEIADLKTQLVVAKNKNGEINRMARVKLIIGSIILFILTIYLFIFYSSTFYSAFFKDFLEVFQIGGNIGIGTAMFDPQALAKAYTNGFSELVFILSAPIIFMGLGYCLHFFMQSKSVFRFLKAGSVLFITLVFDCILAYLIGKKIYDIEVLTSLSQMPPFTLSMAIEDINFWAVIFCGFIVYLIWGIVFDMVLTAYEDLRSNRHEIESIRVKIDCLSDTIRKEEQKKLDSENALKLLESEKAKIEHSISQDVHFDLHIIRLALSDFYAGWISMMNSLSKPTHLQEEAQHIYNNTIDQLFQPN